MKIPSGYYPSAVLSKDKDSPGAHRAAQIRISDDGRRYMGVTDGHIGLAFVVDEAELDEECVVPIEILEAVEKGAVTADQYRPDLSTSGDTIVAHIEPAGTTKRTIIADKPADLSPDLLGVIRKTQNLGDVVARVRISAKLLARLAKGMGTDRVELVIRSNHAAIEVRRYQTSDEFLGAVLATLAEQ